MDEMPVLKAIRRLITPQFVKPEWIRWVRNNQFCQWEFTPDGFCKEHSLTIDFNHSSGGVSVHVGEPGQNDQEYCIPWCDPECDTKVVKILKDWFVMLWKEGMMDVHGGFPNPSIGGERPES